MSKAQDPLVGTWTLNPEQSEFDVNHRPQAGTMVIERDEEGRYVIKAEGISEKGEKVTERPATLVPDGQPRPVPDLPGLTAVSTRPDPKTIHSEVRREDGSIAGQGTFVVHGKGGKVVVMPLAFPDLKADLELHLVGRNPDEYLLYPRKDPTRPMDPASLHRWLKRSLERAGRGARFNRGSRACRRGEFRIGSPIAEPNAR
jgi:hypothetical protein